MRQRRGVSSALVLGLALVGCTKERPPAEELPAANLQLLSTDLRATAIVATLADPLPKDRSALWCASFQLAWNELKKLAGEPVLIERALDACERLNAGKSSSRDLDPQSFYAAAGFLRDGIDQTIREGLARQFPDKTAPNFSDLGPDGVVAYAYLQAAVAFTTNFAPVAASHSFTDASGQKSAARFFEIPKHHDERAKMAAQVDVLFWREREDETPEFALDPCKDTMPYQLILAGLNKRSTLEVMFSDLERASAEFARSDEPKKLESGDSFLYPGFDFLIEHRFHELQGLERRLINRKLAGLYVAEAFQSIRFRLNESGARLESEARILAKKQASEEPRRFHFDRPFLLVLKKRDVSRPVFVMWIENAELLAKSSG